MNQESASNPLQSLLLEELKKVFAKWLFLTSNDFIDVVLATIIANRLPGDPLWMMLVASPSSGKTEVLRTLGHLDECHFLSIMTPRTFISGYQGGKASLLPELDGKILVLKDFTSILGMRREDRSEMFSQLREIFDGKYSKRFGNDVEINWRGKMGLIASCTNVIDQYSSMNAVLGERFLQFRLKNEREIEIARQAEKIAGREAEMRSELKEAVVEFFKPFTQESVHFDIKRDETIIEKLLHLACFCAIARAGVQRDRQKVVTVLPEPESPARLVKQFKMIGLGLAIVRGEQTIDGGTYKTIKKIGRSLLPNTRMALLKTMWSEGFSIDSYSWVSTGDLVTLCQMPLTTGRLQLENCEVLGLVNKRKGDKANDEHPNYDYWTLSKKLIELAEKSEVFIIEEEQPEDVPF